MDDLPPMPKIRDEPPPGKIRVEVGERPGIHGPIEPEINLDPEPPEITEADMVAEEAWISDELRRGTSNILKRAAKRTGVSLRRDDPELIQLASRDYDTARAWYDAVEDVAFSRKRSFAAAVATGSAGPAPAVEDADTLAAKIRKAISAGAPTAEIARLRDRLAKNVR